MTDFNLEKTLLAAAQNSVKNAYAPYSLYRVGCAVYCSDGQVYSGCNTENASYGATLCAERNAVAAAVNAGARDILTLAVISSDARMPYPCGVCLQFMSEFAKTDFSIILQDKTGKTVRTNFLKLLPNAFKL